VESIPRLLKSLKIRARVTYIEKRRPREEKGRR
jgi:hypothetical protein